MSFASMSRGKEVAYITSLLSIFGVVETGQMRKMFHKVSDARYGQILYRLQKEGMIYIEKSSRYISTCRYAMEKSRIPYSIMAFWAMIKLSDKIDSYCGGTDPVLLSFSSGENEYDLIPVTDTNRKQIEENAELIPKKLRRILVVSSMAELDGMALRSENDYAIAVEEDGSSSIYKIQGGDGG